MPEKTVAQKMRLKPGMTASALFAPDGLLSAIDPARAVSWQESLTNADAVLLFARTQAEFESRIAEVVSATTPSTSLWVCYPKGSRAAGLDISRDTIWSYAEARGMRPVGMVSLNETWSGFRLKVKQEGDIV